MATVMLKPAQKQTKPNNGKNSIERVPHRLLPELSSDGCSADKTVAKNLLPELLGDKTGQTKQVATWKMALSQQQANAIKQSVRPINYSSHLDSHWTDRKSSQQAERHLDQHQCIEPQGFR